MVRLLMATGGVGFEYLQASWGLTDVLVQIIMIMIIITMIITITIVKKQQ